MTEARDGDVAHYEQCHDPECSAHREGFNHAHLMRVDRAETDEVEDQAMSPHWPSPHLDEDGHCLCACSLCVSEWQPMEFGGARRRCVCGECSGGDCPNWRLDRELFEQVTSRG